MAADADAPEDKLSEDETASESAEPDASPDSDSPQDAESSTVADESDAVDDAEDFDAATADAAENSESDDEQTPVESRWSVVRLATVVGLIAVLALSGVVGWLGYRTYQLREEQAQRAMFLQVGRQGAVNLTTIDWHSVNADIQRILDSATGSFYDDFSKRSQPFIDVVKKVQSKSVGTVTEAGLESVSRNEARVLVAVSVKTSNLGDEDQPPRGWRMRIDVQKVDDGAKVSNVLFVPA